MFQRNREFALSPQFIHNLSHGIHLVAMHSRTCTYWWLNSLQANQIPPKSENLLLYLVELGFYGISPTMPQSKTNQ